MGDNCVEVKQRSIDRSNSCKGRTLQNCIEPTPCFLRNPCPILRALAKGKRRSIRRTVVNAANNGSISLYPQQQFNKFIQLHRLETIPPFLSKFFPPVSMTSVVFKARELDLPALPQRSLYHLQKSL